MLFASVVFFSLLWLLIKASLGKQQDYRILQINPLNHTFTDPSQNNAQVHFCSEGLLVNPNNNQCEASCPSGYYKDSIIGQCVTNCSNLQFKNSGNMECERNCSTGKFGNITTQTCDNTCSQPYVANSSLNLCTFTCTRPQVFSPVQTQYGCMNQCPSGYGLFKDMEALFCTPQCRVGSYTDLSTQSCAQICSTGYADIITGTCIQECYDIFFGDPTTKICKRACPNGYFANNFTHKCQTYCTNGYFGDETTNKCVETCPLPNTTFVDNVNMKCVVRCPENTFADLSSGNCTAVCPPASGKALGNTISGFCEAECPIELFTDEYFSQCVTTCKATLYQEFVNTTYKACKAKCNETLYGLVTNMTCVTQCPAGMQIVEQTKLCISPCDPGKYYDVLQKQCTATCTVYYYADSLQKLCTKICSGDQFTDKTTWKCVDTCPSSYFSDQLTKNCSKNCTGGRYADATTKNCTTLCSDGYFADSADYVCRQTCTNALMADQSTKACVQTCPNTTTYTDFLDKKCYLTCPAPPNKFTHEETRECLSECPAPYVGDSVSGNCTLHCPTSPKFLYMDLLAKRCSTVCSIGLYADKATQNCSTNCSAGTFADDTTAICGTNCSQGKFADSILHMCVTVCTNGTLANPINFSCDAACPSPLLTDKFSLQCLERCLSGYYEIPSTKECNSSCPLQQGLYADTLSRKCLSKCSPGYFADNYTGSCVQTCLSPFYSDPLSQVCVRVCPSNLFREETTQRCTFQCSSGLFADTSTMLCSPTCSAAGQFADPTSNTCVNQCPQGFSPNQLSKSCFTSCPLQQYFDFTTQRCVLGRCPASYFGDPVWQICTQTCQASYYADNSTGLCVTSCPAGTYASPVRQTCSSTCEEPYFADLVTNKCVLMCPAPYFSDNTTRACLDSCPKPQYSDVVTNQCRSICPSQLLVDQTNYQCLQECPAGYIADYTIKLCTQNCPAGFIADYQTKRCVNQQCTTIQDPYYDIAQKQCVSQCPQGFFGDSVIHLCTKSCTLGSFANFDTGLCDISCPFPQIPDSIAGLCVQKCTNNQLALPTKNKCVLECPEGQFANTTSAECIKCHASCRTCKGSADTDCLICAFGSFFNKKIEGVRVCVTVCQTGTYANLATGFCEDCPSTCAACQQYDICTQCVVPLMLDVASCLQTCPARKYYNQSMASCASCDSLCQACQGHGPNNCTQCFLDKYLMPTSGTCLEVCPDKWFADKTQQKCSACPVTCQTCLSLQICLKCELSYILGPSQVCVKSTDQQVCGQGYYYNFTQQICQLCTQRMASCLSCSVNDSSQFICDDCGGSNYYFDYNTFTCTTCASQANQCQSCSMTSVTPKTFTCICKLLQAYRTSTKTCTDCNQLIPNCKGKCYEDKKKSNALVCEDCGAGWFFDSTAIQCKNCAVELPGCVGCIYDGHTLQPDCFFCAAASFYNHTSQSCLLCSNIVPGCFECALNRTSNEFSCLMCVAQGRFFFNPIKHSCEACALYIQQCQSCRSETGDASQIRCLQCSSDFYLEISQNQCVSCQKKAPGCHTCQLLNGTFHCSLCSLGYALNTATSACLILANSQCDSNCESCVATNGKASCEYCRVGYFLNIVTKVCMEQMNCLDGYYFTGKECALCQNGTDSNCVQCHLNQFGIMTCDVCNNNFQLVDSKCVLAPGTKNCPYGCTSCQYISGLAQCLTCQDDYIFDSTQKTCTLNCDKKGLINCQRCKTYTDTINNQLNICVQCKPGFEFSKDNQCIQVATCSINQFFSISMKSCQSCPSNCEICIEDPNSLMTCISCAANYDVTQWGECIFSGNQQIAQPCPTGCLTCTLNPYLMIQTCSSCNTSAGYTPLTQSGGVIVCILNCGASNPNCKSCIINSVNQMPICQLCNQEYSLDLNKICVKKMLCSSTTVSLFFHPGTRLCEKCPVGCAKCYWEDLIINVNCTFPSVGYTLARSGQTVPKKNVTQSSCPEMYYADTENEKCDCCPPNCYSCSYDSNIKGLFCLKCFNNYVYAGQKLGCIPMNESNIPSPSNQLSCSKGYYFSALQEQCLLCPLGCLSCGLSAVDQKSVVCIRCDNDVDWVMNKQLLCISRKCLEGFYFNADQGCSSCPPLCRQCYQQFNTGQLVCQACFPDSQLDTELQQCKIAICPTGSILSPDQCKPCPDLCETCVYNPDTKRNKCIKCLSIFQLSDSYCLKTCLDGQYYGFGGDQWVVGCHTCPTGCTKCQFNFTSKAIYCSECDIAYKINTLKFCIPFDLALVSCATSEMIVINSASGTVKCQACSFNCKSCVWESQREICLNCSDSAKYSLDWEKHICVPKSTTTCPSNQYLDYVMETCIDCPSSCTKCLYDFYNYEKPKLICTACQIASSGSSSSYFLKQGQCVLSCPQGQYPIFKLDDVTQQSFQHCEQCSNDCLQCEMVYTTSPPQEICYQCKTSGFYLSNGLCKVLKQCRQNEYLIIQTQQFGSFQQLCLACPAGCKYCSATDQSSIKSAVICGSCEDNYRLNDIKQCLPISWFEQKTCKLGQYLLLSKDSSNLDIWNCINCPLKCASCDKRNGSVICLTCAVGLQFNNFDCLAATPCQSGQYSLFRSSIQDYVCIPCPIECTICALQNYLDELSLTCSQCSIDYVLVTKNGINKCLKQVANSSKEAVTTLCQDGYYPVFVDGFGKCNSCVRGCTKCMLSEPTNPTSKLICTACIKGYELIQSRCSELCSPGMWMSFLEDDSLNCQPCNYLCQTCSGPGSQNCTACLQGYRLSEDTKECVQYQAKTEVDCGLFAFYNKLTQVCECYEEKNLYIESDKTCRSLTETITQKCAPGFFFSQADSKCQKCCVLGDSQSCVLCTGPQPSDCQQCVVGQFFNKIQQTCMPCQPGCESCFSYQNCDRCQAGFFSYTQQMQGLFVQKCMQQCPSGTLPQVGSLYLLNKDLFTEKEIQIKLAIQEQSSSPTTSSFAIAVGVSGEPIFDNLPWKIINRSPVYNNMKVRLECQPCKNYCVQCAQGMLYVKNQTKCIKEEFCPDGYYKFQENNNGPTVCEVTINNNDFKINRIIVPSLTKESNIQPKNSQLMLEAYTSSDSSLSLTNSSILYEWSVIDVKQDIYQDIFQLNVDSSLPLVQQKELTNDLKQQARQQLIKSVNSNAKILLIPPLNLQINLAYQIQLQATLVPSQKIAYESIWVHVRDVDQTAKSIQSLGVKPSQLIVTPLTGFSGNTTFKVQYTFSNVNTFQWSPPNTWKFKLDVAQGLILMVSFKANDIFEFMIPLDKSIDQTINIKFTISNGQESYEMTRTIIAKANPGYDVQNAQPIQKLSSSSGFITVNDILHAAAMINKQIQQSKVTCSSSEQYVSSADLFSQGPCRTSDLPACCGNGICKQGVNTYLLCQCTVGFVGLICNIPQAAVDKQKGNIEKIVNFINTTTITQNNIDQLLTTIKLMMQSEIVDKYTIQGMLQKVESAIAHITDSNVLNLALDSLGSIRKASLIDIYQKDVSKAQQQQINTFNQIKNAVQKQAQQLSLLNPVSQFRGGEIHGKNVYLKQQQQGSQSQNFITEVPDTKNSSQSLKVKFTQDVTTSVPQATAVSIIVAKKDQLNIVKGGLEIKSDNLEISLLDSSGNSLAVNNITGECPISFTMNVADNTQPNFTCVYYNKVSVAYETAGCKVSSITKVSQDNYVINCCCIHLSIFGIKIQSTDQTSNNPSTNPTSTTPSSTSSSTTTNNLPQTKISSNIQGTRIFFSFMLAVFICTALVLF